MLEPLAASVFSSIFSTRPFTGHSSSSQSALRMVARASGSKFSQDFFTPHPRRPKGKERASLDPECSVCGNGVQSCARSHPTTSLGKRQLHLIREPTAHRQRARRSSHHRLFGDTPRSRVHPLHSWIRKHDIHQKRHVSNHVDQPPHLEVLAMKGGEWRQTVIAAVSERAPPDLDDAWAAYESLRSCGDYFEPLDVETLLDFAKAVVESIPVDHTLSSVPVSWAHWGKRARVLLEDLDPRIRAVSLDTQRRRWHALMSRTLAFLGEFEEAIRLARLVSTTATHPYQNLWAIDTYRTIIVTMRHRRNPSTVLEFIVMEWDAIGQYLSRPRRSIWRDTPLVNDVAKLRLVAQRVVSCIELPVAFMSEIEGRWSDERRARAGGFLVEVLCDMGLAQDAVDVMEEMKRQGIQFPLDLATLTVRSLVKQDAMPLANDLFANLFHAMSSGPLTRTYQSLGLYLFAHQGDVKRAEEFFNRMDEQGWIRKHDKAMMMQAHAVRGDVHEVDALWERYFPADGSGGKPTILHYAVIIFAHAQRGDRDGMNRWLETMGQAGIQPDSHIFTIILQSFAKRGEVEAMSNVLDKMREEGIPPSPITYTIIISLLAKRKDAQAAEVVYERALEEGVLPDRRMISALMDAYIESGSWRGVVRAFDYLKSSRSRGIQMSIEVYNSLLKAYVLIGAPWRVVATLFQGLRESGIRPDAHTFSLIIQAACDGGLMRVASDLFVEMERMAKHWRHNLKINVYVLTILMTGYLRYGDRVRAKAVYDDMLRRGIRPTSVSYGAIIKAYSNQSSRRALRVAEGFIQNLMQAEPEDQDWLHTHRGGPAQALNDIYAPLIHGHASRVNAEKAEAVFQQLLNAGGVPSLGILTGLLHVYRRKNDLDAVRLIWSQIQELAMKHGEKSLFFDTTQKPGTYKQRGILCVPLSIYMDALSAAGEHFEIVKVWQELKQKGLSFDSHNWNHLAVALVRAGELERAFDILEKVIIPRRRQALAYNRVRDDKPSSPLLSDVLSPDEFAEDEIALPDAPSETQQELARLDLVVRDQPEPPLSKLEYRLERARQRRAEKAERRRPPPDDGARDAKDDDPPPVDLVNPGRRASAVALARRMSRIADERARPHDFVHPLYILYQVRPAWSEWRPHTVTIKLLRDVLLHLESGRIVEPIKPDAHPSEYNPAALTPSEIRRRAALAGEILGRLYDNYPDTVQVIRDYEMWKLARASGQFNI